MSPLFRRGAKEGEPPLPSLQSTPSSPPTGFRSASSSHSDAFVRSEAEPRPTLLGLLAFLFLKPRRFFKHFHTLEDGYVLYVLAFSCGLAAVLSRLDSGVRSVDADTWAEFWLPLLLFGMLYGLLIYFIGDWFFKLCLRWSGDRDPDKAKARKIFLWSGQITALPVIASALVRTAVYPRPSSLPAAQGGTTALVMLGLWIWSLVVDYIGVCTIFNVRRGRAAFWFLTFPIILVVILMGPALFMISHFPHEGLGTHGIAGGVSAGTSGPAGGPTPVADPSEPYRLPRPYSFEKTKLAKPSAFAMPELAHPNSFSSRTLSFSYPRNWTILKKGVTFEPDSNVWVQAPCGSVQGILLYESALGEKAALDFGADSLSRMYQGSADVLPFEKWGNFTGMGRSFQGKEGIAPVTVRVFATSISENLVLEIREVLFNKTLQSDGPGHELIRNSLKLKGKGP